MNEHVQPNRSGAPDDLTPSAPPPHLDERRLRPPSYAEEIRVHRVKKSWLYRSLEVETPEGVFHVEYNGQGIGYESVLVNGRQGERKTSLLWFVPRFDFALGRHYAYVEVRVWPWLVLRSLALFVDGECVYSEGI